VKSVLVAAIAITALLGSAAFLRIELAQRMLAMPAGAAGTHQETHS